MDLTVVIPAHNPDRGRLFATLDGLRRQTLDPGRWATLVVDNASSSFPSETDCSGHLPPHYRVVREPELGLSSARRRGVREAGTPFIVFADDDNVLAPDYLAQLLRIFEAQPRVGLVGGKSIPQFESEPAAWTREFFPLLALRDLGDAEMISHGLRPPGAAQNQYPHCAPLGAGMGARASALQAWTEGASGFSDRRGSELSSAGDNDIVLCALEAGWEVGYFPQLSLTHLIPSGRLDAAYLARLNRGIQKSWMQVLSRHGASSWPPIGRSTVPTRKLKAWWTHRAWRGPAERIRWQGACGHFEGRVLSR